MNENQQLPYGLSEPLHLIPGWFQYVVYILILLPIILAILYWILKNLPRIKIPKEPIKEKVEESKPLQRGIKHQILIIKRRYNENKEYREGIFELSALIKTRLEQLTGRQIEEMTLREIEYTLSEKHIIKFLQKIYALQYQPRNPDESDFNDVISDALKYVAYRKKIKLKNYKV